VQSQAFRLEERLGNQRWPCWILRLKSPAHLHLLLLGWWRVSDQKSSLRLERKVFVSSFQISYSPAHQAHTESSLWVFQALTKETLEWKKSSEEGCFPESQILTYFSQAWIRKFLRVEEEHELVDNKLCTFFYFLVLNFLEKWLKVFLVGESPELIFENCVTKEVA